MRLALHQPDQAGNVGTILRLVACLGVPLDVIEPCGFPWGDKALKRAGMDYAEIANVTRHESWKDSRRGWRVGWSCSPPPARSGWTRRASSPRTCFCSA